MQRRELLKMAGVGVAAVTPAAAMAEAMPVHGVPGWVDVRMHGAKGDGAATDSPAINRAIDAAAAAGGGTVYFPAGVYLSYSIRLKSNVVCISTRAR